MIDLVNELREEAGDCMQDAPKKPALMASLLERSADAIEQLRERVIAVAHREHDGRPCWCQYHPEQGHTNECADLRALFR